VNDISPQEDRHAIDNAEIARVLQQIADMLEFKNENQFKYRSYQMAAEMIGSMGTPIAEIAERGGASGLQQIPGIGKTISSQILEIIQTGKSPYFEELTKDIPASVLDLRRVSGIGLKTAQLLFRDFGIKSLAQLKSFADGGGLASVPGLGDKTVARVKASLARLLGEE
jgi:DNA polymerase (family 10)